MTNLNLVISAVSAIVDLGKSNHDADKHGKAVALAITALFADVNGNDADFINAFGNGKAPKAKDFKAGALAEGVRAKVAKLAKDKRDSILAVLKTRLSEARRLRKQGGMPAKGETIQQALKRYAKAPEKTAKPEGNTSAWAIPETASMDEIADQLSVWIAKHGNASTGLASKLADFLPISIKRNRKTA